MPNPFFMLLFLFLVMLALKPDTEDAGMGAGTAGDREQIAELSQAWLAASFPGGTVEPGEIRINGDWAYARGSFTADVGAGAKETDSTENGRYLLLCEKVDGRWKVLHGIDSVAPSPLR